MTMRRAALLIAATFCAADASAQQSQVNVIFLVIADL